MRLKHVPVVAVSLCLGLMGLLVPVAVGQDEADMAQNEPAWREALAGAGNDDASVVVFPDANHLFQDAETGSLDEYSELAAVFTADFLPTLVDWVAARAGVEG